MPIGLSAAKSKLQIDIQNALKDGFKATYIFGDGDEGDLMATKFAQKASGPIADAILSFVQQAQIVGTNSLLTSVIAQPMGGPCSGSLAFTGTELSLT